MKTPPRFAIDATPAADGTIHVTGPEAHHIRDVMRITPGETITLIGATGLEYSASLERYLGDGAELRVLATRQSRQRPRLILAQAIIKGPRMDFIVEKAAELGATELWPVVCARGLVRTPGAERHARWNRLAVAACKQSMLAPPMRVREVIDFRGLIRDAPRETLELIGSAGAEAISAIIERTMPRAMLIAIGPEGDFDAKELAEASEAGFVAAGLGPARLRSETAALAALAIAGQFVARGV
jgi:16S rRNA (uracil1498-N3)-methyltransferase